VILLSLWLQYHRLMLEYLNFNVQSGVSSRCRLWIVTMYVCQVHLLRLLTALRQNHVVLVKREWYHI